MEYIIIGAVAGGIIGLLAYLLTPKKAKKQPAVEQTESQEQPVVEQVEKETEEVVATTEEVVETEEEQAEEVEESEDDGDDDKSKRIPFVKKILSMDEKVQGFYDELNNKFKSMRKINPRISVKGVSYRLGRELVAKLTIRGKTMRLHLALDVNKFEENVYFQKDLSDVKAYAEVPFTVKVKSDRGLRNAIKLVDALVKEKGIEYKSRYNLVDSIAELKK